MIRYLADASLRGAIVRGCRRREPAMDFLSASDAKLEGAPDPEVLAIAARLGRILVSHDFRTMPWHLAGFLAAGGSSPGVILVPQNLPVGEEIAELVLIWSASEAEDWRDRIVRIPLV